jgi:altronate dehydratase
MFQPMQEDMDSACGKIISGEQTVVKSGSEIFERIVAVASGENPK